jgi:hypothetical protein
MKVNQCAILQFHYSISWVYCSEVYNKIQEGLLLTTVTYNTNLRKITHLYMTDKMTKENEERNFEHKIFSVLERFHINPYLIMLKMTLFMMYGGKYDHLLRK